MPVSKKELRRYNKADLLRLAAENNIEVRKSVSKNVIVDMLYKNKSIRDTLSAPPKRGATPAQLEARKKFAEFSKKRGKAQLPVEENKIEESYKKPAEPLSTLEEKVVKVAVKREKLPPKPTASNQPDLHGAPLKKQETAEEAKKIEENIVERNLPIDSKELESELGKKRVLKLEENKKDLQKQAVKTTDYKHSGAILSRSMKNAQYLKRHNYNQDSSKAVYRTQQDLINSGLKMEKDMRKTRTIEEAVSRLKTTDEFDRAVSNGQALLNKERMDKAILRTQHKDRLPYNEDIVDIDNELGIEESNPMSKLAELLLQRQNERDNQAATGEEEQKEETPDNTEFRTKVSQLKKPALISIALRKGLVRVYDLWNHYIYSYACLCLIYTVSRIFGCKER